MIRHLFKRNKSAVKDKGFSLIELSVVMSVSASAIVGFLAWTQPTSSTDAQKSAITQASLQEIQKAIENFRVQKKRLPCPADPLMLSDNTRAVGDNFDNPTSTSNGCQSTILNRKYDCYWNDFGMEDLYNTYTTATVVDPDTGSSKVTATALQASVNCPSSAGAIPVFALGLDESYMNDAWGRRFTYRVSPALCGTDGLTPANAASANPPVGCTDKDYQSKSGTLVVKSTIGGTVLANNAAYVVISHGANGYGAFLPSGLKPTTLTGSADEANNYGSTAMGTDAAPYVKKDKSTTFDDLVLFETKAQLENLTNRKNTRNISVADCEANSTAIKNIVMTETNLMKTHQAGMVQQGNSQNTGDQALLSVLWATQSVCIAYYGVPAKSINGQTWSGAQCPGNNNTATNGSTYDAASNSCSCPSGSWDGTCTLNTPPQLTFKLWLDTNDLSTLFGNSNCSSGGNPTSGTAINCIKDKSGMGYNATSNAYNTSRYYTNAIGSMPAIRFSEGGSYGDGFIVTNTAFSTNLNSSFTIFLVTRLLAFKNDDDYDYLGYTSAGGGTALFYIRDGEFTAPVFYWRYNSQAISHSPSLGSSIYTIQRNSSSSVWKDGSLVASGGAAANLNLNSYQFAIGWHDHGMAGSFDGYFAELKVNDTALSTTDIKSVESELGTKWGITVAP